MIEIALGILLAWVLLATIQLWLPLVWGLIKILAIVFAACAVFFLIYISIFIAAGV